MKPPDRSEISQPAADYIRSLLPSNASRADKARVLRDISADILTPSILPNCAFSIYGTSLGPGSTMQFSTTPGNGNEYYELVSLVCSEEQGATFGFTSLRIGGREVVRGCQTTPTAPIASAIPWTAFVRREWEEEPAVPVFDFASFGVMDGSSPITGTIANMTTFAAGDSRTMAPRMTVLVRTLGPEDFARREAKRFGRKPAK